MDQERPPPHPQDDRNERQRHEDRTTTFYRLLDQALDFIKTRRSDHWVMFFIGLIIGLILG